MYNGCQIYESFTLWLLYFKSQLEKSSSFHKNIGTLVFLGNAVVLLFTLLCLIYFKYKSKFIFTLNSYVTQYHLLIFIGLRRCLYHMLNFCVYVDLFVFLYLTLLMFLPIHVPITQFKLLKLKVFLPIWYRQLTLTILLQFSNQLLLIFFHLHFRFLYQVPHNAFHQKQSKKGGNFYWGCIILQNNLERMDNFRTVSITQKYILPFPLLK